MAFTTAQIQESLQAGYISYQIYEAILAEADPWFLIGELCFKIFQIVAGIPDPFEALMAQFAGRPKMEATIDEAKIFQRYHSPVTQMLAAGAAQLVNRSIPVSSPDAAPVFGPFFAGAQRVENAIRFGAQAAGATHLTNATLSQAMYEAGNPAHAGAATLNALQSAYNSFAAGAALAGHAAYVAVKDLAEQAGADAASKMSRGWAEQYINAHPAQFPTTPTHPAPPPTPPHPPAGTPPAGTTPGILPAKYAQQLGSIVQNGPPGRPMLIDGRPTGKWAAQWYDPPPSLLESTFPGLTLGPLQTTPAGAGAAAAHPAPAVINFGQSFAGNLTGHATLHVQFKGGPYPTAHAVLEIDGKQIGDLPARTTRPDEPIPVNFQWDSKTVTNGQHRLTVKWIGERGTLHDQLTTLVYVSNALPPPPPPEPPPPPHPKPPPPKCPPGYAWNPQTEQCEPLPPPQLPLPWNQWFDICRETPNCDNLSQEALAVVQSIANVAGALNQIFRSQQSGTIDPCCHELLIALANINTQIASIAGSLHAAPPVTSVIPALEAITGAIDRLNAAPHPGGPGPAPAAPDLSKIIEAVKHLADKTCCPDLEPIIQQLKRRNDDLQVPEDWKKALIESKSIPAELSGLLQSTIWDTVATTVGAGLGHALGWGEEEIEGAAAKVGRFIIYPVAHLIATLWKDFMKGFGPQGGPAAHDIAEAVKRLLEWVSEALAGIFGFEAGLALEFYESGLSSIDTTTEAGAREATKMLLGKALHMGEAAHILATLPEIAYFTKSLGLHELAAFVAKLADFEGVLNNTHRPMLFTKLGRPAMQVFNRKYPTELPPAPLAMDWHARRLLAEAEATHSASSAGYAAHWHAPMLEASYRPIQPRALTSLFEDQEFPRDQVDAMLNFAGVRDADKHTLLNAYEWNSTKNVRNQFLAALTATAEAGLLDADTVDSHLDSLRFSKQARNYVHSTIALKRLDKTSALFLRQVTTLYETGQIGDDQYVPALQSIGLAEAEAEAHFGVDQARLKGKELAQERTAAAKAAAQLLKEQIAAIHAAFMAA